MDLYLIDPTEVEFTGSSTVIIFVSGELIRPIAL